MEQLLEKIKREVAELIKLKEKINKSKEQTEEGTKRFIEQLEKKIEIIKEELIDELKNYSLAGSKDERISAIDRIKETSEIIEQVNKMFNINDIEKLRGFLTKKERSKKQKRIDGKKEEWEKWKKYYRKCYEINKINENEEIKALLNEIQQILKRKIEKAEYEFSILKRDINEQNETEDKRNIYERISQISKEDIAKMNKKIKEEYENNKQIYEKDDERLKVLMPKFDELYKKYVNNKSKEPNKKTDYNKSNKKEQGLNKEETLPKKRKIFTGIKNGASKFKQKIFSLINKLNKKKEIKTLNEGNLLKGEKNTKNKKETEKVCKKVEIDNETLINIMENYARKLEKERETGGIENKFIK